MASLTRSAVVPAPPQAVWEVLADAYTLPRWWPQVSRVEGVEETGFTTVMYSRRGRPVRLDQLYREVDEPVALAWELDMSGGQLARLLSEWWTRFVLEPVPVGAAGDTAAPAADAAAAAGPGPVATRVSIEERQSFRGSYRTGVWMQRRASRRRLDGALAGLAGMF